MSANKTRPTNVSVFEFIASINDEKRRSDSTQLLGLMKNATGAEPVLWGPSIIGFGSHHYIYESGREGDSPKVAFAPRKQALVLYGLLGLKQNIQLLANLGPHKQGKGCLYIKTLAEVDGKVLANMINSAYSYHN
jgi:hypothetical protein